MFDPLFIVALIEPIKSLGVRKLPLDLIWLSKVIHAKEQLFRSSLWQGASIRRGDVTHRLAVECLSKSNAVALSPEFGREEPILGIDLLVLPPFEISCCCHGFQPLSRAAAMPSRFVWIEKPIQVAIQAWLCW